MKAMATIKVLSMTVALFGLAVAANGKTERPCARIEFDDMPRQMLYGDPEHLRKG